MHECGRKKRKNQGEVDDYYIVALGQEDAKVTAHGEQVSSSIQRCDARIIHLFKCSLL